MNPVNNTSINNGNFPKAVKEFLDSDKPNKFSSIILNSLEESINKNSNQDSNISKDNSLAASSSDSIAACAQIIQPKGLNIEMQKRLAKGLLEKIQVVFKENFNFEFNLNDLNFLDLEEICELVIIKYFMLAYSFRSSATAEIKSFQEDRFWKTLFTLFKGDEWQKPGKLASSLNELCVHLKLPQNLQTMLCTKHPFNMLERCYQQKDCCTLSLYEIGFTQNTSDGEPLKRSATMLIQMQKELILEMKPFIQRLHQTSQKFSLNSKKEEVKGLYSLTNIIFNSNDFLNKKFVFLNNSLNTAFSQAKEDCDLILSDLNNKKTSHFRKFINNSFSIFNRILKLGNSIITQVNSAEEQFGLLSKNQSPRVYEILSDLDHVRAKIFSEYYFWLAQQIDVVFLEPLLDFKMTPSLDPMPPIPKFFDFLYDLEMLKVSFLILDNYEIDKNLKEKFPELVQKLLDLHKNEPQFYKDYLAHIVKNFESIQTYLFKLWNEIHDEFLNKYPLAKFLFAKQHHIQFLNASTKLNKTIKKIVLAKSNEPEETLKLPAVFFALLQKHLAGLVEVLNKKIDVDPQTLLKERLEGLQKFAEQFPNLEFALSEHVNDLQEIQSRLSSFSEYFFVLNKCGILKSLAKSFDLILASTSKNEETNLSWIFDIDQNYQKIGNKNYLSKKSISTESNTTSSNSLAISENLIQPGLQESTNILSLESSSSFEVSLNSLLTFSQLLSKNPNMPPHKFAHNNSIEKICEMDQIYHLNHFTWTLEMIEISLKTGSFHHLGLLGSNLINHLYLAQEQALTPFYVSTDQEARHGLVAMSRTLGFECSPNNDNGSIWFRYPHSSQRFYLTHGLNIPKGLEAILSNDSNFSNDPDQLQNYLEGIINLSKEGIRYLLKIFENKNLNISPKILKTFEESFNTRIQNIFNLTSKDNFHLHENSNSVLSKELYSLSERLKQVKESLKKHVNQKASINASISDLSSHINRLLAAMDLLKAFPEQKYLSIHERNVWVSGQYLAELSGIIISQLQENELHTHNLQSYVTLFDLEQVLSQDCLKLLEEIDMKKGSEYIYRKFSNKQGSVPFGLKCLSEAYEISMHAAIEGEGFLPSCLKNLSLPKEHSRLINLISREVDLIESLVEKKIV